MACISPQPRGSVGLTIVRVGVLAGDHAWEQLPALFQEAGIIDAHQCDISVCLFQVIQDGVLYGLVYERTEEDEEEGDEHVMLEPNDIMFHPPWDGEYSS